jgi:hypothetical protein
LLGSKRACGTIAAVSCPLICWRVKSPFVGWNTIIGKGEVGEPATDLMVDVTMVSNASYENLINDSLEIRVTDKSGKILARRRVVNMLVPAKGALHNALWWAEGGCAGKLTFHARFRKQVKIASRALDCGE